MSEKPELTLSVWFQDKQAEVTCDSREPLVIGRKFLQSLFGVNGTTFLNISRKHLVIYFDEEKEQFWARDNSLLGTLVRSVGSNVDDLGPEFLYHHEQFLIKRRVRLRLQNENTLRDPDDIVIEVENTSHDETRPILHTPAYWDRLLTQLHSVRTAHLVGVPGTGKSTLAKKLLAPVGTAWQRQRDRQLGGSALVAWIDCYLMIDGDDALWHRLARHMLMALHTAAEDQFAYDVRDEIASALNYFEQNASARIGQITPVFRQALRAVVKSGARPVFIFDHFDEAYSQLDKFMLYQMYQFHHWPEVGEALRYVIITRQPLEALRNDNNANGVAEFFNLFNRYSIQMNCWEVDDFRSLWRQVAPGHSNVSNEALVHLHQMSGGHPGLTRELYEELAINDWLRQSDNWHELLARVDWESRPPQSCRAIWQWLRDDEQQAIINHLNGEPLSAETRDNFRTMGLLLRHGEWFSPLFEDVARNAKRLKDESAEGLVIDVKRRRVYVDGKDVTGKLQGRKLDVLLYMHEHTDRLCDYEELIKHTLPHDTAINEVYIESERGALQRAVSRLCRIVDPDRQWIQNEQGQGYIMRSVPLGSRRSV